MNAALIKRILRGANYAIVPILVAVGGALLITAVIVGFSGASVTEFAKTLIAVPSHGDTIIILNQASLIALASFAAAICFRMNILNIGIEGQYIIGSCVGAFFASSGIVPGPLNILATLIVSMIAGAAWSLIAAVLNITRGVSEVISTLMLNYVALNLAGFLVKTFGTKSGYTFTTGKIPASSQPLGFTIFQDAPDVWALAIMAIIVGAGYSFALSSTRFGFELRTTGASRTVALASGISPKRMILIVMGISGAVAGILWMPSFFGSTHTFGIPENFQAGLGFTGLAVALLGRNTSIGIGFGSLLFSYLSTQSNRLQSIGLASEVVEITQGVVILMVVIAFEVSRRVRVRKDQEQVARDLKTLGAVA